MKKNQRPFTNPKDTASARKKRLQQRLQEISDKSEQELMNLMKSLDKIKSTFRSNK